MRRDTLDEVLDQGPELDARWHVDGAGRRKTDRLQGGAQVARIVFRILQGRDGGVVSISDHQGHPVSLMRVRRESGQDAGRSEKQRKLQKSAAESLLFFPHCTPAVPA